MKAPSYVSPAYPSVDARTKVHDLRREVEKLEPDAEYFLITPRCQVNFVLAKQWLYFCSMFGSQDAPTIHAKYISKFGQGLSEPDLPKVWTELNRRKHFLLHRDAHEDDFDMALCEILNVIKPSWNSISGDGSLMDTPSGFLFTPLVTLLPNPIAAVSTLFDYFSNERFAHHVVFQGAWRSLRENTAVASGLPKDQYWNTDKFIHPSKSQLPLEKLITAYFQDTRIDLLLLLRVPLKWTHEQRTHHTHVLGSPGTGKSSLVELAIQHDILEDLLKKDGATHPRNPSVVLIDPHSDLAKSVAKTPWGNRRVILIDAADEFPPAVNMFAMNRARLAGYDPNTRERVTAGVMQSFDYFFGSILGVEFTAKQSVVFRHLIRLLLSFPESMGRNATLRDMHKLTIDPTPYLAAIQALPEYQRAFFERDFLNAERSMYKTTKEELRYRIDLALMDPVLSRFLTAPETKIDLFDEMNRGSVILIDCGKDLLQKNAPIFGRIWLSLILRALAERAALEAEDRHPTYLYVDEAGALFDQNVDELLTDVRKFNCACLFSHQRLNHASEQLRSSLSSSTATKICSTTSSGDASAMARDMRTSPEVILNQPPLHFAMFIKGTTPHAVSVEVRRSDILKTKMDAEQWGEFMALNRHRTSLGRHAEHEDRQPVSPPAPDEEISKKW